MTLLVSSEYPVLRENPHRSRRSDSPKFGFSLLDIRDFGLYSDFRLGLVNTLTKEKKNSFIQAYLYCITLQLYLLQRPHNVYFFVWLSTSQFKLGEEVKII